MSKQKMNRLRKYAKNEELKIDEEMTERLRNSLSDTKINIRVPSELKEKIMEISERKNIPYQRYIKSILIEAISKDKAS